VEELQKRRAYLCRLTPDRALESQQEALEFLKDRGMLTRTPDSALPSLFEACHEEPYAAGSRGFGSWPATKYPWYFDLAERPDVHELKVHNGKSILLTEESLALVDGICRSELARMEGEAEWARLLAHLAAAGPSTLTDLQTELDIAPRELKSLRAPLERCGAVVARSVVYEDPHRHTSELARWDQRFPEPAEDGGLAALVVAGVRAAVLAPERELPRWFPWWEDGLVERLVGEGQLVRPEDDWVAAQERGRH
jgi:hypothetical protein